MVAISVCDKPFKPLILPSGRVKFREGFQVKDPQKIILKTKEKYFWGFQNRNTYTSNWKIMYTTQAIATP